MTNNDSTSALLALPIELVDRIADSLGPESLLMLRLTCKVLEHSTYDRFAKTFFERRSCCIYYEPRWLLLEAIIRSRLGNRLRYLEFTSKPFEDKLYQHLQLAPGQMQAVTPAAPTRAEASIRAAQIRSNKDLSFEVGPHTQTPAWPSMAVFSRVFRDIKTLAPNAFVKLDFLGIWKPFSDDPAYSVSADVLTAALTTGITINALGIAPKGIHWLDHVAMSRESQLVASCSYLRCFRYEETFTFMGSERAAFITMILNAANDLRKLSLRSMIPSLSYDYTIITSILQANNFAQLSAAHNASYPRSTAVRRRSHQSCITPSKSPSCTAIVRKLGRLMSNVVECLQRAGIDSTASPPGSMWSHERDSSQTAPGLQGPDKWQHTPRWQNDRVLG